MKGHAEASLHQESGLHQQPADDVGVQVGGGAPVLVVPALVDGHHASHADGAPAVGHPPGEVVNGGGLVLAGQAALVALAVRSDVHGVALAQLLHLLLDVLPPLLGDAGVVVGEVDVTAGAVPVTGDGLGVQGDLHVVQLGATQQNVTGHPHLVAGVDAGAGTHLVLPLGGHDFGVHARDVDPSEQACLQVRLDEVAPDGVTSSGGAVVRALGSGEAVGGPSQRPFRLGVQDGVLLLDAEPGLLVCGLLHDGGAGGASVGGDGLNVGNGAVGVDLRRHVGVAHHEDVVATAEGIPVNGTADKVHFGVITRSLQYSKF